MLVSFCSSLNIAPVASNDVHENKREWIGERGNVINVKSFPSSKEATKTKESSAISGQRQQEMGNMVTLSLAFKDFNVKLDKTNLFFSHFALYFVGSGHKLWELFFREWTM